MKDGEESSSRTTPQTESPCRMLWRLVIKQVYVKIAALIVTAAISSLFCILSVEKSHRIRIKHRSRIASHRGEISSLSAQMASLRDQLFHANASSRADPEELDTYLTDETEMLVRIESAIRQLHDPTFVTQGDLLKMVNSVSSDSSDSLQLARADLRHVDLAYLSLRGANLRGANLAAVDIEQANLEKAMLQGADLRGANLKGANLKDANLNVANLEGASLEGATLEGANLGGAYLEGANLQSANLRSANLQSANLQNARFVRANLRGATLSKANLHGAQLQNAGLYSADLTYANLHGAQLQNAGLYSADLTYANLKDANLTGVRFSATKGPILSNVDLKEAKLKGSIWYCDTRPWQDCKGAGCFGYINISVGQPTSFGNIDVTKAARNQRINDAGTGVNFEGVDMEGSSCKVENPSRDFSSEWSARYPQQYRDFTPIPRNIPQNDNLESPSESQCQAAAAAIGMTSKCECEQTRSFGTYETSPDNGKCAPLEGP